VGASHQEIRRKGCIILEGRAWTEKDAPRKKRCIKESQINCRPGKPSDTGGDCTTGFWLKKRKKKNAEQIVEKARFFPASQSIWAQGRASPKHEKRNHVSPMTRQPSLNGRPKKKGRTRTPLREKPYGKSGSLVPTSGEFGWETIS